MATINTSAVQWDLTLIIGGEPHATCKPKWKDVIELEKLEDLVGDDKKNPPDFEVRLRNAMKGFFPGEAGAFLDALEYDDLIAAMQAASTYFTRWLKKKRDTATTTAAKIFAPPAKTPAIADGKS